jgi:hypothetical protein
MSIQQPTKPKIDNTLNPIEKAKIEKFYEFYKNKILDTSQEKFLENFREQIYKLNEQEIKIARYEKYDSKSTEMIENYKVYISTAKKVFID